MGGRGPPEPSMLGRGAGRVDECLLLWVGTPFCLHGRRENGQATESSELGPDQVLGSHARKTSVESLLGLLAPGEAGERGSLILPRNGEKTGG